MGPSPTPVLISVAEMLPAGYPVVVLSEAIGLTD